jgi:TRAP-type C4-dicarboxylate transport system substrate-binding protein
MAGDASKAWTDLVTERSGGAIRFNTYYGGSLGGSAELWDIVEAGGCDVVLSAEAYAPGKFHTWGIEYSFPFGPPDPRMVLEARRQWASEFPQVAANQAEYNVKRLTIFAHDWYHILSKEPINSLDDMEGKVIGAAGRWFGRWMEATGATPVVSSQFERYEMLRTGVEDMDLLPDSIHHSLHLFEQAKYDYDPKMQSPAPWGIFINLDVWADLPDEVQKIMLDAGTDSEDAMVDEIIPEWLARAAQGVIDEEVQRFEFPDRQIWIDRLEDSAAEYGAELESLGYPGWDMVKRWREITTDLGFVWDREWGMQP